MRLPYNYRYRFWKTLQISEVSSRGAEDSKPQPSPILTTMNTIDAKAPQDPHHPKPTGGISEYNFQSDFSRWKQDLPEVFMGMVEMTC